MGFLRVVVLLGFLTLTYGQENDNPDVGLASLIIRYPKYNEHDRCIDEDLQLMCTSWRFGVEANNLGPWRQIPQECDEYVEDYMLGKGYQLDLQTVSKEAGAFAASHGFFGDGKDVWVFDVDETLISNLPYYSQHGFGLELFDHKQFDEWVEKGVAPAIPASLELYQEVVNLGYKIFLLTGRSDRHRGVTIENLVHAGFHGWDKLIMRNPEDHVKSATIFKSEKRNAMVEEGYRIVGNSGDQWSDLLGSSRHSNLAHQSLTKQCISWFEILMDDWFGL